MQRKSKENSGSIPTKKQKNMEANPEKRHTEKRNKKTKKTKNQKHRATYKQMSWVQEWNFKSWGIQPTIPCHHEKKRAVFHIDQVSGLDIPKLCTIERAAQSQGVNVHFSSYDGVLTVPNHQLATFERIIREPNDYHKSDVELLREISTSLRRLADRCG